MATKKRTISVRLDESSKRRVEKAARLMNQSSGAFLETAGEERARQILLTWVVSHHRQGLASFSELASESGLAVEELMDAVSDNDAQDSLEMFLASCKTIAEIQNNPDLLKLAEQTVKELNLTN